MISIDSEPLRMNFNDFKSLRMISIDSKSLGMFLNDK